MSKTERDHLVRMIHERGEVCQEIDGFYGFSPSIAGVYIQSHQLRWIADEIDRMNKPIIDAIESYFRDNPPSEVIL